jgi:hypothetical protein
MFSLELPEHVTEIGNEAFSYCRCLRNVAFPPDAVYGDNILGGRGAFERYEFDLNQLFGSIAEMIRELQHRFDELPIHKLVYYQSYHQRVLQNVIALCQRRTLRSKLDSTGNHQDCLGMTPLHILACSSVHDLELYRVIVENYPTNLITEDRWEALPLLYAFWGNAPAEIIHFLLDSYQSLYPSHVFNWTMMMETMGRCDTPKERIENLLRVKQMHFPEQPIDWGYLLDKFANSNCFSIQTTFSKRMQFLVMCGMSDRVQALAFSVWRDYMTYMIQTSNFKFSGNNWNNSNSVILHGIKDKLVHFEEELPKLKQVTTILELALWKMKINEKSHQDMATNCQKKIKADDLSIRSQYRVACGANVVISHVLPYLLMMSALDDDSDSESSADDNDEQPWNRVQLLRLFQ